MTITNIEFIIPECSKDARLISFVYIEFESSFCCKDIRMVKNDSGKICLAFPNQMVTDHCHQCRAKTKILDRFCFSCGTKLAEDRHLGIERTRRDIFFPIRREVREWIEKVVVDEFKKRYGNGGV